MLIRITQFSRNYAKLRYFWSCFKSNKKYEYTQVSSEKREDEEQEHVLIFTFVSSKAILNELPKLDPKNACQESDIPVKT